MTSGEEEAGAWGSSQRGWRGGPGLSSEAGKWSEREPRSGHAGNAVMRKDRGQGSSGRAGSGKTTKGEEVQPAEELGVWTLKSPRTTYHRSGQGKERGPGAKTSGNEGGPGVRCDNTRFKAVAFQGRRDGCASAQERDEEADLSPGTAVHRAERKADQPASGGGASRQTGVGSGFCHCPEVEGDDLLNGERCRRLGFGERCWQRPGHREMPSLIRCWERLLLPSLR